MHTFKSSPLIKCCGYILNDDISRILDVHLFVQEEFEYKCSYFTPTPFVFVDSAGLKGLLNLANVPITGAYWLQTHKNDSHSRFFIPNCKRDIRIPYSIILY